MVLILTEHTEGVFKKKSLEAVQYGSAIAQRLGVDAAALVLGPIDSGMAAQLGAYGAKRVLHVADDRLKDFNARAFTKAFVAAAEKTGAKVLVASHDAVGRQVAPRAAVRLKAGMIAGAASHPDTTNGFTVRKAVFAGKAFADVTLDTDIKVLTLMPNTFPVTKGEGTAAVEPLEVSFTDKDFSVKVQSTQKVTGTVPLSEAELVVSGGRGLKGPENWGVLEDLASALGASLACSRPVADSHWRPHHEHVGQTGGTIRPNLYIAAGISGAIQHLAGVNGSKTIVVINKDPEAPFFKAADYGIVGDVLEILPKLTAAVKKFKETQG